MNRGNTNLDKLFQNSHSLITGLLVPNNVKIIKFIVLTGWRLFVSSLTDLKDGGCQFEMYVCMYVCDVVGVG